MNFARSCYKAAVLALGLECSAVFAADIEQPKFSIGGFGTIGGAWHNADGLEFRRHRGQPKGVEAGKVEFGTDSLAGMQINGALNQEFEGVIQATSRLNPDNSWRPKLTRGFVRYTPDEALMLRAGRLGYDIYLMADSRDIGYSYLTIRPPVEVYGVVPSDHFDGADVTLTHPMLSGLGRLKLYAGRTTGGVALEDGSTANLDGSKVWGGYVEYIRGSWQFRLSSGTFLSNRTSALDPLITGLRQTGQPQALTLADHLARKDRHTNYYQASVAYDEGPLQAQVFVARLDADSAPGPKLDLGYVSAGYRLGKFTPYTALSAVESYADILPTGLPDIPVLAPLNAGARRAQLSSQATQRTVSLGVRYDFAHNMDLKLQVDRVWLRETNLVFDRNTPPLSRAHMTVFGLALDFVF